MEIVGFERRGCQHTVVTAYRSQEWMSREPGREQRAFPWGEAPQEGTANLTINCFQRYSATHSFHPHQLCYPTDLSLQAWANCPSEAKRQPGTRSGMRQAGGVELGAEDTSSSNGHLSGCVYPPCKVPTPSFSSTLKSSDYEVCSMATSTTHRLLLAEILSASHRLK